MRRWGRLRANFYFKCLTALLAILVVPESETMYKNDGTERNNDNLYGHVLEYNISKEKRLQFEKCIIEGAERDISYFTSYERNDKVFRLIFSYNQSIGKSADSIKECTEEAFKDINHYIEIWASPDLKSQLIETFGEHNLNFSPLNNRVNGFGHDRHVVKYKCLQTMYSFDRNKYFFVYTTRSMINYTNYTNKTYFLH